jgi:hypothetical protein
MATIARRRTATGPGIARTGLWGIARVVSLITAVVVGLIVIGIVLVLLDANRNNAIVDWLVGAAGWLAEPFKNIFNMNGHKQQVAVNYGLAAVVYALVGGFIARLLRR